MAGRESLDDKLAAIRELRGQTLAPEQIAQLRKRIGDKSNLVVAAAAAVAGESTLAGWPRIWKRRSTVVSSTRSRTTSSVAARSRSSRLSTRWSTRSRTCS